MILHFALGLVAGALLILLARSQRAPRDRAILAIGLVVAALIYLVFAIVGDAAPRWVGAEAFGVVLFALIAWLGVRRAPMWLAVGWAAHAVWDGGLHMFGGTPAFMPAWYPPWCTSIDLLVAGYIAVSARTTRGVDNP